jgi:hypothetical protein
MNSRVAFPVLVFVVAILSTITFCQEPVPGQLSFIVQKLEQAQSMMKPRFAYEVIREYRLFGTNNLHPSAEVTAELDYRPPNQKTYAIQKSSGSSRGEQVVKRILDHEAELASQNSSSAAELSTHNYNFSYLGKRADLGKRYFLLRLQPKRKDKNLVTGVAWVDENTFLVRHIEGELAQSPSWWIKKVHVNIDFADLAGAWQQSHMEAVADVRFIGTQTIQSETTVNVETMQAQGAVQRRRGNSILPAELLVVSPKEHH